MHNREQLEATINKILNDDLDVSDEDARQLALFAKASLDFVLDRLGDK